MSNFLQPLQTVTIATATNSVTFSSINQNYTDLVVFLSIRGTYAGTLDYCTSWNNSDRSSVYSDSNFNGTNGTYNVFRDNSTTAYNIMSYPAATSTSSTFGSGWMHIPNYASSTKGKTALINYGAPMNSTGYQVGMWAGTYNSTTPITSVTFYAGNANFAVNSKFSLYGVLRAGI